MTPTFQPPFLEFAADIESREAQTRARIRAQNHISPRCSICLGCFVGDIAQVIEFARVGDVDMPGFDSGDLICGLCWFARWDDEGWGTA
jgi:hypothetical protein